MNILVTGAAGFIGFHLAQRLLARGDTVTGIDSLNVSNAAAIALYEFARRAKA